MLRAAPDSHPIVPDAADDASVGVSVDIADAVEADIAAAERAAAAADAEDATVASEAATAEVTDDAQAAVAAAEQTAVGGQVSASAAGAATDSDAVLSPASRITHRSLTWIFSRPCLAVVATCVSRGAEANRCT